MAGATSRDRVRRHRELLRKRGLKPVQIWVPDTRAPGFAAEARRQSRLVANSRTAEEDQAFVDSFAEWDH